MTAHVPSSPFERARQRLTVSDRVDPALSGHVLTPRDRRMVEAYVTHGTYAAAAEASGYAPATVKRRIEGDSAVRDAISERVRQSCEVVGITYERVLQEYGRLAFSDIGDLIEVLEAAEDSDVALKRLIDLPASITAAISSIDYRRTVDEDKGHVTGHLKVKLHDKKGALTDLARMMALFQDRVVIEDTAFGKRLREAVEKVEAMEGVKIINHEEQS